jgi:transmembrane sensor
MSYLQELFRKYVEGALTETERRELYNLLQKGMADEALREMIDQQFREWSEDERTDSLLGKRLFEQMENRIDLMEQLQSSLYPQSDEVAGKSFPAAFKRLIVAACLLLVAGGTAMVIWHSKRSSPLSEKIADLYKNDIKPGGNKASLTLANGTVIDLDSIHNGLFTRQGSVAVSKQGNGQLLYTVGSASLAADEMNVLATPRGGQYQVILPDGTKALLNAASSLRYPTAFTGKERRVILTGEAYFEVAKDPRRPFLVEAANMRVQVLGTSFDIMAYDNETMVRTTLLTGKIKEISQGHDSLTLAPGQQAVLRRGGSQLTREVTDTDEVIAWKDGLFLYSNRVDIPTIMRQLERWYDIHVHYQGAVPAQTFYGGIQRSLPLSKVLSILERTGVKFKIEGQDITVLDSPDE